MGNWMLRVPSTLLRLALDKAGSSGELNRIVVGLLSAYVNGQTAAQSLASQGGKARAEKLTPEQRSAIARKGAAARYALKPDPEPDPDPDLS